MPNDSRARPPLEGPPLELGGFYVCALGDDRPPGFANVEGDEVWQLTGWRFLPDEQEAVFRFVDSPFGETIVAGREAWDAGVRFVPWSAVLDDELGGATS